jgi:hypothetical protein
MKEGYVDWAKFYLACVGKHNGMPHKDIRICHSVEIGFCLFTSGLRPRNIFVSFADIHVENRNQVLRISNKVAKHYITVCGNNKQ